MDIWCAYWTLPPSDDIRSPFACLARRLFDFLPHSTCRAQPVVLRRPQSIQPTAASRASLACLPLLVRGTDASPSIAPAYTAPPGADVAPPELERGLLSRLRAELAPQPGTGKSASQLDVLSPDNLSPSTTWPMAPWLRFLEAWMVQQLLRTPAFHRGVEKVARTVHRYTHGIPPEEMGGTKIDSPASKDSFLRHFSKEIQTQLGRAEARVGDEAGAGVRRTEAGRRETSASAKDSAENAIAMEGEEESADSVWRNAQKVSGQPPPRGFMGEYIGALREQVKGQK